MYTFYLIRYFHVYVLYLMQKRSIKNVLDEDLKQIQSRFILEAFRHNYGFRNLFYARCGQGNFKNPILRFCKFIDPPFCQFEIAINAGIGGGLHLYHNMGAILNAKSIGENCKIYQGVTIGKGKQTDIGRKPVIGNNVEICTNAVCIGGIRIGDNAVVGAGAVVITDVPSNAVVGGVPARILYYRND